MGKSYEPPISNVAERLKEAMGLRNVTAADLSRTTQKGHPQPEGSPLM